jgi:hypothetical protein
VISAQSPVPIKSPIFGPAYVGQSSNLIDDLCINLYPEVVEVGDGREVGALYGTPGLLLWNTVGHGPIRRMHVNKNLNVLYVVSDSALWSVSASGDMDRLGFIGGPGGYFYSVGKGFQTIALPFDVRTRDSYVTMADNGSDLAVFVGMTVEQQDGFGIVNQPGSYKFFQSKLLSMLDWPPLQLGEASADPDNIVAIVQIRRELFVIKQVRTEVWNNVGSQNFVFAREQGPYIQAGCVAPASVAKADETIFWLGQNTEGRGVVVMLNGYSLQRVSNFYIEREIQSWPDMTDAIGYAYQQDGHTFYVLSSESGNQTWVYDYTLSALTQKSMWHQRTLFTTNPGGSLRHPGNCAVSFMGLNLVGDNTSGNIYSYDTNTFTDNGVPRTWLRSWRATQQRTGKIQKFSSLRLDMQTGIGVPSTVVPRVMLRWSDDGGHNYVPMVTHSLGETGQTSTRVTFRRLGALRAEVGYDRIFELSGSDPVPVAIIGALLNSSSP